MRLTHGKKEIVFDIEVETPKGMLYCVQIKRNRNNEVGTMTKRLKKCMMFLVTWAKQWQIIWY